MVVYEFTVEDLARMRFAISPSFELVRSLQALRDPSTAALHLPWLRGLSGRLGGLDLEPVVALVPPSGYSPDFLTPPPTGPVGDIESDLARMRATPAAQVRKELGVFARVHRRRALAQPWLDHPRRELGRLTDTLEAYWERALEPVWPRIRAFLEADLAHRARRLTEGGPAALFEDLHPTLHWHGDRLEVHTTYDTTVALAGRGLLLVPSAFAWERAFSMTDAPWQPTVVYPARGVSTLWEDAGAAPEGLARVLGETRARLLAALDAPRSTTELARRLGLSAGGISQHLSALKSAGLVSAGREGRLVLYVRTPRAEALLAG
jgi:hypothetical protein